MTPAEVLLVVMLCLLGEGFFSGSEIAIINADRLKLKALAERGSRGARMILRFLERPEYLISTCLVGTNFMNVTSTTVATMFLLSTLGHAGEWVAILVMSPLILLLGEIIPKTIYQHKATELAPLLAYPISVFYYLFAVLVRPLTLFGRAILFVASGGDPKKLKNPFVGRDLFRRLIVSDELTAGGDLKRDEKQMISRVLDFSSNTVEDVMVPLIEVRALSAEARIADVLDVMLDEEFSRYPVFEERIDNIIGILYSFDVLLNFEPERRVRDLMQKAFFVPESIPLEDLLRQMQKNRISMAIVVDEFGGAVGIITMEDILEEIVGEIEDEYDEPEDEPTIRRLDRNKFFVNARVEVDMLNEIFPGLIPEGEYTTIGGLVLERLKHIPEAGEDLYLENGLRIQVMEVSERAVESLLLTIPQRFVRRRMRKKQLRSQLQQNNQES